MIVQIKPSCSADLALQRAEEYNFYAQDVLTMRDPQIEDIWKKHGFGAAVAWARELYASLVRDRMEFESYARQETWGGVGPERG